MLGILAGTSQYNKYDYHLQVFNNRVMKIIHLWDWIKIFDLNKAERKKKLGKDQK